MKLSSGHIACAVAVFVLAAPSLAAAQSRGSGDLSATVERLERQLQTLERTVYRGQTPPSGGTSGGAAPPPAALSDLQITTTSLEEQMRRLTGQVEQLQFQVRQINDRMDRLVADVDFRLRELEGGAGGAQASRGGGAPVAPAAPQAPGSVTVEGEGAGAPRSLGTLTESQLRAAGVDQDGAGQAGSDQTASVAPVPAGQDVTLPDGSVQERYNYARQFLLRRDFVNAETAFAAFVDAHPEDPLAGNAQYWLGETFYVRGDYQTAAVSFAKGFQQYPDSDKAPDNLLKLGMSLGQLGQNEDACITLQKLRVEYPEAPTSIVQRADREIGRLKCR